VKKNGFEHNAQSSIFGSKHFSKPLFLILIITLVVLLLDLFEGIDYIKNIEKAKSYQTEIGKNALLDKW
jgi:hypothetical protein